MSGGRPWSDDDTDTLLELAGTASLAAIAVRLGRTRDACAMKLHKSHTGARSARGELTGAACAALYQVPVSRVYRLIRAGTLRARRGAGRYWLIDPASAAGCAALRGPKRTHRDRPPDVGDYWQRYGYVRRGDRRAS